MPVDNITASAAKPTAAASGSGSAAARRSENPVFTRSRADRSSSASSDGSDNEDVNPDDYVTVYRGIRATGGKSVAYWSLSPYARTLVDEGRCTEEQALVRARKAARFLCKDPKQKQEAIRTHSLDSSQPLFIIHNDRVGRSVSPFVSVTTERIVARSFAGRRCPDEPADASSRVLSFTVRRSKLITNLDNRLEHESLIKGGINPRHRSQAVDPL